MRLSEFEGRTVIDARGRVAGKVANVLFDPELPELVGFEVRLRPFLYTLERPRRYIARTAVTLNKGRLELEPPAKLERVDGRKSGVDWEQAVIWSGMPVAIESAGPEDEPLGILKDVDLGAGGRVKNLLLTRGATSDAAIGTREIAGELILGFSREAIRVDDTYGRADFSGGVAAGAGRGTAIAKVKAEQAAIGAARTAATAARAVKRLNVGKRASDSWTGFARGMREGFTEDEAGGDRGSGKPKDSSS